MNSTVSDSEVTYAYICHATVLLSLTNTEIYMNITLLRLSKSTGVGAFNASRFLVIFNVFAILCR